MFARLVVTAVGLLVLGVVPLPASAQAPETPVVTFDAATFKRNKEVEAQRASVNPNIPQIPGRAQTLRGGNLVGRGMTVRELIRDAYGFRNRAHGEVVGGPDWINTERYDLQAKASGDFPASTSVGLPPSGEMALRGLLAERLKLKVRLETARRPIYELVLQRTDGRLGPNLTPSKGGCRSFFQREPVNVGFIEAARKEGEPEPLRACATAIGLGMILAENMPMTDWVKILSLRPQLNRTVIDRTGLAGNFDIRLRDTEPSDPATYLPPPIKPMLESQLGLTLRDAEGPVEILVIENVERPTEN
jgi:uncharacterized protein (TIGR03435 family)